MKYIFAITALAMLPSNIFAQYSEQDSQSNPGATVPQKSPIAAQILASVPSLGHLYANNWKRGLGFVAFEAAALTTFIKFGVRTRKDGRITHPGFLFGLPTNKETTAIGKASLIALLTFRVVEVFDAKREAERYNKRALARAAQQKLGLIVNPTTDGVVVGLSFAF